MHRHPSVTRALSGRSIQQLRVKPAHQRASRALQRVGASGRGSSMSLRHKIIAYQSGNTMLPPSARTSCRRSGRSPGISGRLHAFPRHHHDDGVAAQEHLGHDAVACDGLAPAWRHLLPDLAHVFEDPAAARGTEGQAGKGKAKGGAPTEVGASWQGRVMTKQNVVSAVEAERRTRERMQARKATTSARQPSFRNRQARAPRSSSYEHSGVILRDECPCGER